MGLRGPAPAPRIVKLARGDRSSRINRLEPVPPPGLPDRPRGLPARERQLWDEVIREMGSTGLLTRADRGAILAYVYAQAAFERAAAKRARLTEWDVEAAGGGRKEHPLLKTVRDLAAEADRARRALGLTPQMRPSMQVSTSRQVGELPVESLFTP